MRRVSVIGCSGGGKSTLTTRLGETLDLPVVHLDTLFWRPGWIAGDMAEFRDRVSDALRQDAWIMDGDFMGTADLRFPLTDTIIWVDQPRLLCLRRAVRRVLRSFGRMRADLPPGCPEKFDLEFLRYIWSWDREARPRVEEAIARFGAHARLIRLRSDTEIADFLQSSKHLDMRF